MVTEVITDTWVTVVDVWEAVVLFLSELETGSVATKSAATTTSQRMYAVSAVALVVTTLPLWPILGTLLQEWTRPRLHTWVGALWEAHPALDLLVAAVASVLEVAMASSLVDLLVLMPYPLVSVQVRHLIQLGSILTSALLLVYIQLVHSTAVRRLLSSLRRMDLLPPGLPIAFMGLENAIPFHSSQAASTI